MIVQNNPILIHSHPFPTKHWYDCCGIARGLPFSPPVGMQTGSLRFLHRSEPGWHRVQTSPGNSVHVGGSINGGTPKWLVYNGTSY